MRQGHREWAGSWCWGARLGLAWGPSAEDTPPPRTTGPLGAGEGAPGGAAAADHSHAPGDGGRAAELAEVLPPAAGPPCSPALHTHRVLKPSRPRNMPLRMDSSWLAVRCSSLTEAAPSKAPSSISDTLLLLRLLGEEAGGRITYGQQPGAQAPPFLQATPPHTESWPLQWELPPPWHFPCPSLASIPTDTFSPMGNSHFLQMCKFFKHPSGLQDGNLIVIQSPVRDKNELAHSQMMDISNPFQTENIWDSNREDSQKNLSGKAN